MQQLISVNNMDNYYEQIVKKKFTSKQALTLVVSFVMIVLVIAACVFFSTQIPVLGPLSLFLLGVGVWMIYYMIKNSGIEYEYTFVGGEMRIERIKGKATRRKVTVFDCKEIDDLGKFLDRSTGKKNIDPSQYELKLHSEENTANDNTYYVVIHDKVRHKRALLTFTPNKITLEKMRPFLSVELKKKYIKLLKEEEEYLKNTAVADNPDPLSSADT